MPLFVCMSRYSVDHMTLKDFNSRVTVLHDQILKNIESWQETNTPIHNRNAITYIEETNSTNEDVELKLIHKNNSLWWLLSNDNFVINDTTAQHHTTFSQRNTITKLPIGTSNEMRQRQMNTQVFGHSICIQTNSAVTKQNNYIRKMQCHTFIYCAPVVHSLNVNANNQPATVVAMAIRRPTYVMRIREGKLSFLLNSFHSISMSFYYIYEYI